MEKGVEELKKMFSILYFFYTFAAKFENYMKKIFISAITLAVCGGVQAQSGRTLSFDDAVSMMFSDNPSIQAAEHEEMAAKRERQAAVGLHFPVLSVGGSYAYLGSSIALDLDLNGLKTGVQNGLGQLLPALDPQLQMAVGSLLGPLMGLSWDYSYTLQQQHFGFVGGSVSLPLFMGGKINIANRAARINERSVREQTVQTRNALMSELVERYFGYALALQVVEVRKQVVEGVRKHLDDALALERNGMIASSERMYVEFKVAEAERELQGAEMQVETLRAALSSTLGGFDERMIPATSIFVVDRIESADYFRELAAEYNPLLNQVEYKSQLARQNVRLQRAEFFPQVVAVGGGTFYNYQVSKLLPRWAVGVGVNFKIFDGLHREYKYSAARQTAQRVEALKEKAGNDISVLVESLYNSMQNCRNQISAIESSMSFAEEYLKAKDAAFREGMAASTDMVDAELNLAKVRIERMQAAYNYDVALARLLEAAGVSEEFMEYMRRSNARRIAYNE